MKHNIGIVVVAFTTAWSASASWLSAHQFIRVQAEVFGYLGCFFGVFFGAAIYFRSMGDKSLREKKVFLLALTTFVIPLLIVLSTWIYADKTFIFWKMRSISPAQWQQMVLDIGNVASQTVNRGTPYDIPKTQLPKSFQPLGRADECWGGIINRIGESQLEISILYGSGSRRWGLLVGPAKFLQMSTWDKFRCIPVTTNACFVVHVGD